MKSGTKALAVLLLFIGLVLVVYLGSAVPWRIDATAQGIYTLSKGTKALLAKIDEPITLDLYFSQGTSGQFIEYKNYEERVREMLRQYVRAAHGKITLNLIDPEPDTPEEDKATAAGVEPQEIPGGDEKFYFGLVATQADQQKAIGALSPDREQFLEYDLSELIYDIQQTNKKKLGLITSLPLEGSTPNPQTGDQGSESQYVVQEWQDSFDIVDVDASANDLPANLDALAIVHPENLTPQLQFAIDQFLLGGKPVFVAVDPSSEYFKRQGGQQAMFSGPPPNVSSDLPTLFAGWGIDYDPQKIVGDNDSATEVSLEDQSVARFPLWLSLEQDNFNPSALPTADLSSMLFVEPGCIDLKPGVPLTFTPLVQTSAEGALLDSSAVQFAQPDDIARQLVPTGKKTIAAFITGKFHTAFPGGPPADATADASKAPAPKPAGSFLKESPGVSDLLVVADTDWLFDDYSVRKESLFGQTVAEPRNDNLAFAANSLDFLAGSSDLISIRGKGSSVRPFKVVEAMEAAANDKYQEKLNGVEAQMNDVEQKLSALQGTKTQGNQLVVSPEVTKEIQNFQRQEASLRAERRRISLALRQGIDRLENRLLAVNLLASPLLLCAFGLWFYRARRK